MDHERELLKHGEVGTLGEGCALEEKIDRWSIAFEAFLKER